MRARKRKRTRIVVTLLPLTPRTSVVQQVSQSLGSREQETYAPRVPQQALRNSSQDTVRNKHYCSTLLLLCLQCQG